VRVAVVGGTGPFGSGLARQLVAAGDEVVLGSRDAGRATTTAVDIGAAASGENSRAVQGADLVVLAVAAEAALDTAEKLRDVIAAPVLSVASRLEFGPGGARAPADQRSLAERTADILSVPVVAGLHSIAAGKLGGEERPDEDALICGDDDDAKRLALELAGKVVSGRVIDAGPLAVASALEGMTAVIVNINKRYKTRAGIHISGLP
jgi:NADPH-dependent F420 reductase